jgi:hypothetical protein
MKPAVREKLKRIHELYPPDRVEASMARWRWLWHGGDRPDRQPFFYSTFKPRYYGTIYPTPEELLHARLDEYLIRGHLEDDYVPALFTGCKTSTIPSMFGAREVQADWTYDCERVLESMEEVPSLPPPQLEGSVAGAWLEVQRYLMDETEGELPVHVADMQGPADVCGKLVGYDQFLIGAYTEPDLFHELMEKVSRAFTEFWEAQRELLGSLFVPTHLNALSWVPNERRASASIDSLDLIGPDFYDEFFRPHLETLGDDLGLLTIHSCGDPSPVMPRVAATRNVAGFNPAQTTLRHAAEAAPEADWVLVSKTNLKDIESDLALIRDRGLRVDLNVNGIWPKHEDGAVLAVDEWPDWVWEAHRRVAEVCGTGP